MAEQQRFDVAIVGGGPAGQAAAIALAGRGLSIAVIDEQARPGGQILRQPPIGFIVKNWLANASYAPLKRQVEQFDQLADVTWLGGHSVVGLEVGSIIASGPDNIRNIAADRILISAGCQDLPVPIAGWTLPGVYAAGGIQGFVKSQQLHAGRRVLFAGTHPLQLVIAAQTVAAGGTVAAVLFAQPRAAMIAALARRPLAALRRAPDLFAAAAAMATLKRAGTPVRYGVGLTALVGDDHVSAAETTAGSFTCDAVGLCYGFVPQSALPRMAGAQMTAAGPAGGWACVHDEWMRASLSGLYVAGETTGVAGAAAAAAGGELAGLGIALDLGLLDAETARRAAREPRRQLAHHRAFASLLDAIADPRGHFPMPTGDTVICRCEDVDHATLELQAAGGASANAIKLATRCGMGPCQGRMCEPTLLRMMSAAGASEDPGFTARFPARPLCIGDLVSSA